MFKVCWHRFKDKKIERTKNMYFGFGGCELPGLRVKQVCEKCEKPRYVRLNIMMPMKYLYEESIWRKNNK